jgi:hypothetical protein
LSNVQHAGWFFLLVLSNLSNTCYQVDITSVYAVLPGTET